jgi:hypothetical protein
MTSHYYRRTLFRIICRMGLAEADALYATPY